ncbi:hypothetical protein AMATHDRAFT_70333 [Amanita thiersii Skay4041]|uniref:Uncharacterized protein n=1 Tax=Amanita thiersii Skay4041 TaxID=703135 RepID=A0A2A9NA85_9AGAR|nr:hypothetical protein AMATHDRAFT_70333 [Amanita thiersii Skay4041]
MRIPSISALGIVALLTSVSAAPTFESNSAVGRRGIHQLDGRSDRFKPQLAYRSRGRPELGILQRRQDYRSSRSKSRPQTTSTASQSTNTAHIIAPIPRYPGRQTVPTFMGNFSDSD